MGDGAVGKTSLRTQYLGEGFESSYHETIGADFALKYSKIPVEEGQEPRLFKFQIWDIAGQPRYTQVRSILFDRSDGGLLLFDLSNRESFVSCHNWMSTYVKYAGTGAVCLIGNKEDLREDSGSLDLVSIEEGKAFAKRLSEEFNRPVPYLETSAKTGKNVELAFEQLAKVFMEITSGQ
jgi:small GTP-binding protein